MNDDAMRFTCFFIDVSQSPTLICKRESNGRTDTVVRPLFYFLGLEPENRVVLFCGEGVAKC